MTTSPVPAPAGPDAPTPIACMGGFVGVLIGLLAPGIVALRARDMAASWSGVPLAVRVPWFRSPTGLGSFRGLAWVTVGYAINQVEKPSPRAR